jgi:NADPH:quinone reductase-like Zn-dependent oxidoreductase
MPFLIRAHRHAQPAAVPCLDFTGTVLEVWDPERSAAANGGGGGGESEGAGETGGGGGGGGRFTPGDAVVGFIPFPHSLATGMGALQGVVAIPARFAVGIPEGRTLRDAAGLLATGCTADMQVSQCGVGKGQRVLVVGASGGVGTMVVQTVRERVGSEGRVVAVCSGKNEAMVKGLGADEVSYSFPL